MLDLGRFFGISLINVRSLYLSHTHTKKKTVLELIYPHITYKKFSFIDHDCWGLQSQYSLVSQSDQHLLHVIESFKLAMDYFLVLLLLFLFLFLFCFLLF